VRSNGVWAPWISLKKRETVCVRGGGGRKEAIRKAVFADAGQLVDEEERNPIHAGCVFSCSESPLMTTTQTKLFDHPVALGKPRTEPPIRGRGKKKPTVKKTPKQISLKRYGWGVRGKKLDLTRPKNTELAFVVGEEAPPG